MLRWSQVHAGQLWGVTPTELGLAKGTPEALKELGQVTGYLRRRLSSAVICANVRCLLERMLQVGEGVGQAGRRRQWAKQDEERARWER